MRRLFADDGEGEPVGLGADIAERGHLDGWLVHPWVFVLADRAAAAKGVVDDQGLLRRHALVEELKTLKGKEMRYISELVLKRERVREPSAPLSNFLFPINVPSSAVVT